MKLDTSSIAMWIILAAVTRTGETITVFDCEDQAARFETIDLTGPTECPDPNKDYATPFITKSQVLQTDATMSVTGYQCEAEVSRQVARCGFTSIQYGSRNVEWKKKILFTPEQCRNAVARQWLVIDDILFTFKMGFPSSSEYFSYGRLDADGTCHPVTFTRNGVTYEKSYEQSMLVITIRPIRGIMDTSTTQVRFQNGLRANFKDTVLQDAIEGTIVWNATEPECADSVSEIYYGEAEVHYKKQPVDHGYQGSIVLIHSNMTRQFAGLVLRERRTTCGQPCYTTQAKGLVVCLRGKGEHPIPRHTFKSSFDIRDSDLQSQLGYLYLTSQIRTFGRFEEVQADICALDRRTLQNKLQSIAGANNRYSLLDLYGPGYAIYVSGAVAYVTKCVAVEATRMDFANCTEEIPVRTENKTGFADPFTWIMKPYPTIRPCSDVMPVRWRVGADWYCSTPNARICTPPNRLNVTMGLPSNPMDFTNGLDGGIYTDSQLSQHRMYQIEQSTREAVLAKVTSAAVDSGRPGHSLGMTISTLDMEELSTHLAAYIHPFFYYFGKAWHYLTGFFLFVVILKVIIGSCLRMWVLYMERGVGWWMIAAVWHTAFLMIRVPAQIIKRTVDTLMDPVADMPMPLRPVPQKRLGNGTRTVNSGNWYGQREDEELKESVDRLPTPEVQRPLIYPGCPRPEDAENTYRGASNI